MSFLQLMKFMVFVTFLTSSLTQLTKDFTYEDTGTDSNKNLTTSPLTEDAINDDFLNDPKSLIKSQDSITDDDDSKKDSINDNSSTDCNESSIKGQYNNESYHRMMDNRMYLTNFKFDHYLELHEIYKYMNDIAQKTNHVEILDIGKTYENRHIKVLKIDFHHGEEGKKKKAIALEAGLRPDCWLAITTALYVIEQLITRKDPDIIYLTNHYVWYIAPVLNPDGYRLTWTSGNRFWNFNKNPDRDNKCVGIDVSRNFPFLWYYVDRNNTCKSLFVGDHPASEMESRCWVTFLTSIGEPLHGYFSMFMSGNAIICDLSYSKTMCKYADHAVKLIKSKHGQCYEVRRVVEGLQGTSFGWASYHFNSTVKLAYGYMVRGLEKQELSPNQILPTGDEIFSSIVTLIYEAEPIKYKLRRPHFPRWPHWWSGAKKRSIRTTSVPLINNHLIIFCLIPLLVIYNMF